MLLAVLLEHILTSLPVFGVALPVGVVVLGLLRFNLSGSQLLVLAGAGGYAADVLQPGQIGRVMAAYLICAGIILFLRLVGGPHYHETVHPHPVSTILIS